MLVKDQLMFMQLVKITLIINIHRKERNMRTGKEEHFWIWDQVKNTNPKYTKAFTKFGGKELTTIDPMYQIQVTTGMFGPVGKGWTYNVKYTYTDKN